MLHCHRSLSVSVAREVSSFYTDSLTVSGAQGVGARGEIGLVNPSETVRGNWEGAIGAAVDSIRAFKNFWVTFLVALSEKEQVGY